MDEKKKRYLTILFLLLNVILWPIFIVPKIGPVSSMLFTKTSSESEPNYIQNTETHKEILSMIDFNKLRDPFLIPASQRKSVHVVKKKKSVNKQASHITPNYNVRPTVATYVSQFKLNSIVKLNNHYIANLEETSHYGSSQNSTVPYSYRFGPGGGQQNTSRAKTHMIIEGDTVMGERVVKITSDYVILSKNNQYYKLTMSGGYSVKRP